MQSVVSALRGIPGFDAGLCAWPDGCVDSEWSELQETPDAMLSRIGVENQSHEALMEEPPPRNHDHWLQAAIAGFLSQQSWKHLSMLRHLARRSVSPGILHTLMN